MQKNNLKQVKALTSVALGAVLLTSTIAVPINSVEAASSSNYKVSKGRLISKLTGKVVKGTKTFKGKVYKDGKTLTGLKAGVFYKSGKKATGTYKGKYYSNGKVYTGVKNNIYFKAGAKATGIYKGMYYSKGKVYTGLKAGVYYKRGKKGTGTYGGKYYEAGKVFTGIQSTSNNLYIDGLLNTDLIVFKGQLYNGSKLNEGVVQVDGKWYKDASIANGTITLPNGKTITVTNGIENTPGSGSTGGGSSSGGTGEITFTSTINSDIANNVDKLGLVGTSVSSSNEKVATVKITDGQIAVTSISVGTSIITIATDDKKATLEITVNANGSITIGTITKYTTPQKN
ncbi:hypothetical protein BK128_04650 [Viridibacillus sp. FSL H7-0596]|uniref:hypothetical protein n=1 Tax=Viridibacillus sp. FSL H7-0596 TaxID=1928923 RepID=UPI00096E5C27|nr:hypothetical protein [Viridibacillus sp. FSL H7-0596]OMC89217.1 hypothetical protein BK128_04650 [Viridibacillus sp. FSL H7-0596]